MEKKIFMKLAAATALISAGMIIGDSISGAGSTRVLLIAGALLLLSFLLAGMAVSTRNKKNKADSKEEAAKEKSEPSSQSEV